MELELERHLVKVRHTMNEVDRIVSSHKYPSDKRTVIVMGLLSTIDGHLGDMLRLLKHGGNYASVAALARDVLNGTRYGLWMNSCATDEQVLRIEQDDEFPLTIPEMTKEIETAYSKDSFFENLKNHWATQLYKYSRSEIVNLGRWSIDPDSRLQYDDKDIRQITTIAILCIVLLAGKFVASQGHSADCKSLETLAGDYTNRAATKSSGV